MFIFECLPLFLLSLFWPSTCSNFLSLSLFCFLLSLFLLVLLFVFFWFLFFFFFFFCLLCFCFMKITTSNCSIAKFFHQSCVFFGVLSCFLFGIPFLIFVFLLIFSYVFCSTSMFFWFQKHKLKKHQFLVKRGGATKRFFCNLCFAKCEKLSFFLPLFWPNFG